MQLGKQKKHIKKLCLPPTNYKTIYTTIYIVMNQPKLSIITINFNNNSGLIKTLESIKNQTFTSYEHIIIDAGSTDGSLTTLQHYSEATQHLTYWSSEPDGGIYDGMNKGIRQAKGEYIYFLNSGDCLNKNILKDILFDGTQYIYGDVILKNGTNYTKICPPDQLDFIFFIYKFIPHPACFIHNTLLKDMPYDTDYKIISDWIHSFKCIIFKKCTYKHIPAIISIFDGGGTSSDIDKTNSERERWLKENLPPVLYELVPELIELQQSEFRNIIPLLNKTHKFQRRARRIVMLLYRINRLFSFHKRNTNK